MKRSWMMGSLLVLAACDGGVPLESIPAEAAGVICGIAETCYGRLADRVGGGAQCRRDLEGGFANGALPRWQAAIDAGTLTYDPALGSACVEAQRAAGCSIFISPPPQACRDMFTGTVARRVARGKLHFFRGNYTSQPTSFEGGIPISYQRTTNGDGG